MADNDDMTMVVDEEFSADVMVNETKNEEEEEQNEVDAEEEDEEDAEMTEEEAEAKATTTSRSQLDDANDTGEEDNEDDDARDSTAEEDNDEEEDDDDDDDENDDASRKKPLEQKVELSDSESMLRMLQSLPEIEVRRHEQFRRSHFERGAIKRCMAQAIQECTASDKKVPTVTQVMAIVMAGMTKVFVGELTVEARRIMEKNGETGPIRPRHLREAHRKYYKRRPLARGRNLRRLFR